MIKKPSELNFTNKKMSMIVAGVPGVGKTTLALSAPKPLLIDLDKGVSRVETAYRGDVAEITTYEELMKDLNGDLSGYETIVIDTGGKLLELLKPVVIKDNVKNGQSDGTLSLKGYGAIKRKFGEFVNFVKQKDKNLIVVFHASEVQLNGGDTTGLRIRIEGSSKDEVWDDMDIGGFVEMRGNKRIISFQNCDRFYAKRTHGIRDVYEVPLLKGGNANTFVADLFAEIKKSLNAEIAIFEDYKKALTSKVFIDKCTKIEDLNKIYDKIKETKHALTSKEELWILLNTRAKELGAKYDKETNSFKNND